MPIENLFRQVF